LVSIIPGLGQRPKRRIRPADRRSPGFCILGIWISSGGFCIARFHRSLASS